MMHLAFVVFAVTGFVAQQRGSGDADQPLCKKDLEKCLENAACRAALLTATNIVVPPQPVGMGMGMGPSSNDALALQVSAVLRNFGFSLKALHTAAAGLTDPKAAELLHDLYECAWEFRSLEFETVATGLASPRHLTVSPNGNWVYVAEAGLGGAGPCVQTQGLNCYGPTGAVSRVRVSDKKKETVLSGLFSFAGGQAESNPNDATGPSQVLFNAAGELLVVVGYGIGSLQPADFVEQNATLAFQGATVLRQTAEGVEVLVDISAVEFASNPDSDNVDSNPISGVAVGDKIVVVDAAANTLFSATGAACSSAVAETVFPKIMRSCAARVDGVCRYPPFVCCPVEGPAFSYPAQAVPSQVVLRPGYPNELYVSEVTGVFWNSDQASVHKLDATTLDIVEQSFLTGFNAITSIAFDGPNRLYVLEQNIAGFGTFPTPNRLNRIDMATKARTIIPTNLSGAFGIVVVGEWLYASNSALENPGFAPSGELVRVNLAKTPAGCPCPSSSPCVGSNGSCNAFAPNGKCPRGSDDKCGWFE